MVEVSIYGITTLFGGVDSPVAGTVLVVLKGLLIALMAWFMLACLPVAALLLSLTLLLRRRIAAARQPQTSP